MKIVKHSLIACCAALLGVVALVAQASAAPNEKLPENYNFLSGISYELQHPGQSLPGSNDFDCTPSPEHPRPVVLVHGTGGAKATNWGPYPAMLANRGYCVFALTYGALPGLPWPFTAIGGMGKIDVSAGQLDRFVDKVLEATGAETVDLVGHSQGTYMPTYYVKFLGGAQKVTKYVSLAPLWHGSGSTSPTTPLFMKLLGGRDMPICSGCGGMMAGSPMNEKIWSGGSPYVKGIDYTNIMTRNDEVVVPYTSGYVKPRAGESVKNIVVQATCSTDHSEHVGIASSRRAAYFVLNALDPEHPVKVPCENVAPITGQRF
ncbi:lipase [Gordonia sp. HY002]|uniref:esterase/lipase family protein n=1 Tax=Gordonia zhenghanii TaxID=2911516 RepID=UPI001EF04296|nr:alpha/beta fold hydrolase [Gordonia zhenghanii]MCF8569150.1 lipase [Gordonia zhenghanii]MCF8604602.1 lipase [Gordonia zhenghanii]